MSNQWNIRCTNAFFVQNRGIVNVDEVIQLNQGEAKDVIAANRGEQITLADYNAAVKNGHQADFKPKDEAGKVIEPDTRTRAQARQAQREYMRGLEQGGRLAASTSLAKTVESASRRSASA